MNCRLISLGKALLRLDEKWDLHKAMKQYRIMQKDYGKVNQRLPYLFADAARLLNGPNRWLMTTLINKHNILSYT